MWKKRIILIIWALLGVGTVGLLIAAKQKKESRSVQDIKVEIEGAEDHVFVDEKEVISFLKKMGVVKGTEINRIDLHHLEDGLKHNKWIRDIQLYFDNNAVLQVSIEEREPIARVFTVKGGSFHIDSSGVRLPLSDELSARVPVFTSFTSDDKKLDAADSLLLTDVKKVAQFIQADSFWMAQTAQVDITPNKTFELIPVLGNQTIVLGNADSLESKFDRLFTFYKQVWAKAGFEKYERIDVQFDGQIVATRRGATKPFLDSAKAMQQLNSNADNADAMMKDSGSIAATSANKVNEKQTVKVDTVKAKTVSKPVVKPAPTLVKAKQTTVAKKETVQQNARQPKAVMKKKN